MCGLSGIVDLKSAREPDCALLHRMNETLFHRGPDEGGTHFEAGVALGHRRLSIIDLSSGQQPLFNEDYSVVVVFNGEIYNFPELMDELKAHGHQFRTHCDTEVIVHAWEQWGEACVERFRGMFAFALWDRTRQTLFLARDRLGVKPLFYAELDDGHILFASELKALLMHPRLRRDIDPQAVEEYFAYGYVPEPRTIFSSTKKLSPGYTLTLRRGEPMRAPQQYWDVPFTPGAALSLQDAQHELIERLTEAVRIRLVAEVPLGAFLSGGVDSSAIVALMAGLSAKPVNTCSIGFSDPEYNESAYAEIVARRYATDHHTGLVEADDFDLIDKLANLYDEPYADSSAMPTYRVCQLARKNVTVALSGDGGDENLAGYRRYRWFMLEERMRGALPLGLRKPVFGSLARLYPKADWAPRAFRAKSTFEALARDSVAGYFHGVSTLSDAMRSRIFSASFKRDLQGYQAVEVLRGHAAKSPTEDALSLIQYLDMKSYLVGDILTKVDRASMAHALEVRVPLLDHKLVEWMSGLPASLKLHNGEGKYLFKKALEPYLPQEILYRSKKGFAVPLAAWFRGPLRTRVREALASPVLADTGLFDMREVTALVNEHQSGQREHSTVLWTLLMFEAFQRQVINGQLPAESQARGVAA